MSTVLASGASASFGYHLVNLIGSVRVNSPGVFDRIVAFDLGLTGEQRALLSDVRDVDVRTVPELGPGRVWKTWIWTHLDADVVVWLDAGNTALRSLAPLVRQSRELGYFVVSQRHPVGETIPSDYFPLYGLPEGFGEHDTIAAGILGFSTRGEFYDRVIAATHQDALLGRSVGFSAGEVAKNTGLDRAEELVFRDCPRFRHEQTLLNIHFYRSVAQPVVHDLDEYAGWRSPHDHPRQVIWNHRRRGTLGYLWRAPSSTRGRAEGLSVAIRWRLRLRPKHLVWTTYRLKARLILRSLRRSPG
jgi:hypothetical protein